MTVKSVTELADHVGGEVIGDISVEVTGAATLTEAGQGDISFLANLKYEKDLQTTRASVVVVGKDYSAADIPPRALIQCNDPYYAFMQIVVLLHGHREHEKIGISPRASVSGSAQIGDDVDIHDFVCISADVQIGDNTRIYPSCTIGPGSKVGKDCIIYPNVTIYDGCQIGDRVTIHAGTVVGQDGFGYATHDGIHHKIPQIGGVIIEDDVEIGSNCAIDRGTLGYTVIGRGTKMSNLVAIGHNTQIGPHCLLVAQVGIAGSVQVGKYCVMGGQVGIVGHIKIGDGAKIGAQAGVTNDVPEGISIAGSPALPITQAKRSLMLLKELPEFRKKLRELDKSLKHLIKEEEESDNNNSE
ncbi:MAG: UDP-3-O-(3-hydroxymyristoyl)glucosamine N-acyltransferase [Sedimentisphaerales bacterium]|nr:UDP-3-O-(3-hydroxymyristoyl)glucosamine N-acyltransferase [Sedimentisphaerales bacterium]